MLFIISCVFSLLGFYFSFFKITHDQFITDPNKVKNYKKWMLFFFGIAITLAYIENADSEYKVRKQYGRIAFLESNAKLQNKKIDSLKIQNDSLSRAIKDTVTVLSNKGITATNEARDIITDAVAKGIEIGVRNSKYIIDNAEKNAGYLTGGEKTVSVWPPVDVPSWNNNKLDILIINKTRYPQFDLSIHIMDNFKAQIVSNGQIGKYPLPNLEEVIDSSQYDYPLIERMRSGYGFIVYSTTIPQKLTEGYIQIDVKAMNGSYTKNAMYKKRGNGDGWYLVNIDSFYSNRTKR